MKIFMQISKPTHLTNFSKYSIQYFNYEFSLNLWPSQHCDIFLKFSFLWEIKEFGLNSMWCDPFSLILLKRKEISQVPQIHKTIIESKTPKKSHLFYPNPRIETRFCFLETEGEILDFEIDPVDPFGRICREWRNQSHPDSKTHLDDQTLVVLQSE